MNTSINAKIDIDTYTNIYIGTTVEGVLQLLSKRHR